MPSIFVNAGCIAVHDECEFMDRVCAYIQVTPVPLGRLQSRSSDLACDTNVV